MQESIDLTEVNSILFICMGNICRSPSAEAVFRHKAAEHGLSLTIDSAGTLALMHVKNLIIGRKKLV